MTAAMLNEQLTPLMADYLVSQGLDPASADYKALITAGSTLVGAAFDAASFTYTATVNNYLKHSTNWRASQWGSFKEELARCKATSGCDVDAVYARWTEVSNQQQTEAMGSMDAMFGLDPAAASDAGQHFGTATAAMNMNPADVCDFGDSRCYSFVQQQNNQASAVFRYGVSTAYASDLVEYGAGSARLGRSNGRPIVFDGEFYSGDGFKFSKSYYERLWDQGRPAPFLQAREIMNSNPIRSPDPRGAPGYFKYEGAGMEMIYNPSTGQVGHIQPMR